MKRILKHLTSFRFWATIVALVLLSITCWHALDLSHDHPEVIFGHGPGILLHGQQDKWLFALLLAAILFYVFLKTPTKKELDVSKTRLTTFEWKEHPFILPILNHLSLAFSQGILNTKRY